MSSPAIVTTPVPVYEGDTTDFFTYTFVTDSVPVDMSAWTFTAQWRAKTTDETALDLIVDDSDAASGIIALSASPETTRAMESKGVWDLQGIKDGEVRTFFRGTTTFTKDVTRIE